MPADQVQACWISLPEGQMRGLSPVEVVFRGRFLVSGSPPFYQPRAGRVPYRRIAADRVHGRPKARHVAIAGIGVPDIQRVELHLAFHLYSVALDIQCLG